MQNGGQVCDVFFTPHGGIVLRACEACSPFRSAFNFLDDVRLLAECRLFNAVAGAGNLREAARDANSAPAGRSGRTASSRWIRFEI